MFPRKPIIEFRVSKREALTTLQSPRNNPVRPNPKFIRFHIPREHGDQQITGTKAGKTRAEASAGFPGYCHIFNSKDNAPTCAWTSAAFEDELEGPASMSSSRYDCCFHIVKEVRKETKKGKGPRRPEWVSDGPVRGR